MTLALYASPLLGEWERPADAYLYPSGEPPAESHEGPAAATRGWCVWEAAAAARAKLRLLVVLGDESRGEPWWTPALGSFRRGEVCALRVQPTLTLTLP